MVRYYYHVSVLVILTGGAGCLFAMEKHELSCFREHEELVAGQKLAQASLYQQASSLLNLWCPKNSQRHKEWEKKIGGLVRDGSGALVGELFLHALEEGNEQASDDILALMKDRSWLVDYKSANYLLQEGKKRFAPFVYKSHQPTAVEAFMRILETSARRRVPFQLTPWCRENNLEEQPVDHENHCWMPCFEHFSPAWYHIQRLRMATYLDEGFHGLDTEQRLITLAHEVGELCLDHADCVSAVPFLFPALRSGDQKTRDYLTRINANNHFVLLLGGSKQERSEAWHSFYSLFCHNEEEAVRFAKTWSSALVTWIKSLAIEGDRDARALFALRSLLLQVDLAEAYRFIAQITDSSEPWLTYLYVALAERQHDLKKNVNGFMISYHNLWYAGDPFIQERSEKALRRYAESGCALAQQLLDRIESGVTDTKTFLELLTVLPRAKSTRKYFEWYLTLMVNKRMAVASGYSMFDTHRYAVDAMALARSCGWYSPKLALDLRREFGALYADAADDRHALTFLLPAANEGDTASQQQVAAICLANPCYIDTTMGWLRPFITKAIADNVPFAERAELCFLLAGTCDDREKAFDKLCLLLQQPVVIRDCLKILSPAIDQALKKLAQKDDTYALLIQGIFALAGQTITNDLVNAVVTLNHRCNPWIIYLQSALQEKTNNTCCNQVVQGFNALLHCGIPFLETEATDGLMRAIKAGNVQAHALLFCDRCETADKAETTKIMNARVEKKELIDYLAAHCMERLQAAAARNALAAYVLGYAYEQQAVLHVKDGEKRNKSMRLALEAYRNADTLGHACVPKIITLAYALAAQYYLENKETEVAAMEAMINNLDTTGQCKKILLSWLESPHLNAQKLDYIVEQLEKLATQDVDIAYKLALFYKEGQQFPSGGAVKRDLVKCLHYASLAADRQHHDAKVLRATILVLQDASSVHELQQAIQFLREQKEDQDPVIAAQINKIAVREEKRMRETDIDLLRAAKASPQLLEQACNRLATFALEHDDDEAMRIAGLFLRQQQDHKNQRKNGEKALPLLERFYERHPEDVMVGKELIKILFYRDKNKKEAQQRAFNILQAIRARNDFVLERNEHELFGILAYRHQQYAQALSWFSQGAMSHVIGWFSALSLLHLPERLLQHEREFLNYLGIALFLGDDGLCMAREQFEDLDFAVQSLLAWNHPAAFAFLARLAIFCKNNKALSAFVGDSKTFGQRLLAAAREDTGAASVALYAGCHKLWGFIVFNDAVDLCEKALLNQSISAACKTEIIYQLKNLSNVFFHDYKGKIDEKMLPGLIKACCVVGRAMLCDQDHVTVVAGLYHLMALEQFLFTHPKLDELRPFFNQSFSYHELLTAGLKNNQLHAFVAVAVAHFLALVEKPQDSCLPDVVQHFRKTILQAEGDSALQLDHEEKKLFARACALCGMYLRDESLPIHDYQHCFEQALLLNPCDREGLWGLSMTLIHHGTTLAESERGLKLLDQLVDESPSKVNAYALAKIYLHGTNWIAVNQQKGTKILSIAADLGSQEAKRMLDGIRLLKEEPLVTPHQPSSPQAMANRVQLLENAAMLTKKNNIDQALVIYEQLMRKYGCPKAATCAAGIYLQVKKDFARAGRCLLQLLEYIIIGKDTDSFYMSLLQSYLVVLENAGKNDDTANFWASTVAASVAEYFSLFIKS